MHANDNARASNSAPTTPSDSQAKTKFMDLVNKLDAQAAQLVALLNISCCENFRDFSESTQTNYLWACSDLAESIQDGLLAKQEVYRTFNHSDACIINAVISDYKRILDAICPTQSGLIVLIAEYRATRNTKALSSIADTYPHLATLAQQFIAEINEGGAV